MKESSFVESERAQNKIQNLWNKVGLSEFKAVYSESDSSIRILFHLLSVSVSPRQELSILTMEEMPIKTICSLQTRKAMACAVYETAPTSLEWKLQLVVRLTREKTWYAGSWLDVSLFSHVGKAIRDNWLVYNGLRTKIYSAAFQCVNLSMYIIRNSSVAIKRWLLVKPELLWSYRIYPL